MKKSNKKNQAKKNLPAAQAGASRFFGGPSRAMILAWDFNHTGLIGNRRQIDMKYESAI